MPGRRNASLKRLNWTQSRLAMNSPSVIAVPYRGEALDRISRCSRSGNARIESELRELGPRREETGTA